MKFKISLSVQIDTTYDSEAEAFKELLKIFNKLTSNCIPTSFSVIPINDD